MKRVGDDFGGVTAVSRIRSDAKRCLTMVNVRSASISMRPIPMSGGYCWTRILKGENCISPVVNVRGKKTLKPPGTISDMGKPNSRRLIGHSTVSMQSRGRLTWWTLRGDSLAGKGRGC